MKFFKVSIILGIFAMLLAFGCQKETQKIDSTKEELVSASRTNLTSEQINGARQAFAKTLLEAMRNEPILVEFIHSRIQQMDETDYELLYIAEKDNIVRDGLKLSEILALYASDDISTTFGVDFFTNIIETCPLLAISMPDLYEIPISSWTVEVIPDIAAVDADNTNNFILYEEDGTITEKNISEEGDLKDYLNGPTLSIWDAEAYYLVNSEGITNFGISIYESMPRGGDPESGDCDDCIYFLDDAMIALYEYEISGELYALFEHNELLELFYDCLDEHSCNGNTGGSGSGDPCESECERDCEEQDEHLVRFKINGWGVFKNIRNQNWENRYVFHGNIIAARDYADGEAVPYNPRLVTPSYKKKDLLQNCGGVFSGVCEGEWKTVDYRIWQDWDMESLGSPYYIDWAEVDNSVKTSTVEFPLTAKFKVKIPIVGEVERSVGVTVEFKRVGEKIVELGNSLTFYCDPIMMSNNTGSIEYQCD